MKTWHSMGVRLTQQDLQRMLGVGLELRSRFVWMHGGAVLLLDSDEPFEVLGYKSCVTPHDADSCLIDLPLLLEGSWRSQETDA